MIPEDFQLKPCPASGSGVHRWIFGAACYAVDQGLTDIEIEPLIRAGMSRNPNPTSEIADALRSARREERVPSQQWAPRDEKKINQIINWPLSSGEPLSPYLKDANPMYFIDRLFPDNPLLCMGKTNYIFNTKSRNEWRGIEKYQSLIVPSPMSALKGKTKIGNLSAHSLENTGPRHYLVIEFDTGELLDQYKLIFHLAKEAPLVLICSSGGKSLHGWFNVKEEDPLKVLMFMQSAVAIGADPRTWLPSQFVRMPDGTRYETKGRQPVIYFDGEQL